MQLLQIYHNATVMAIIASLECFLNLYAQAPNPISHCGNFISIHYQLGGNIISVFMNVSGNLKLSLPDKLTQYLPLFPRLLYAFLNSRIKNYLPP